MENKQTFIKELHDLLEKWNVEINIDIEGDTHGVNTYICVDHRIAPPTLFKYEEVLRLNDELSPYSLKKYI